MAHAIKAELPGWTVLYRDGPGQASGTGEGIDREIASVPEPSSQEPGTLPTTLDVEDGYPNDGRDRRLDGRDVSGAGCFHRPWPMRGRRCPGFRDAREADRLLDPGMVGLRGLRERGARQPDDQAAALRRVEVRRAAYLPGSRARRPDLLKRTAPFSLPGRLGRRPFRRTPGWPPLSRGGDLAGHSGARLCGSPGWRRGWPGGTPSYAASPPP